MQAACKQRSRMDEVSNGFGRRGLYGDLREARDGGADDFEGDESLWRGASPVLNHLKRMNSFNLIVARKVFCVEGQDALHTMDMHGCNEAGIMDLDA